MSGPRHSRSRPRYGPRRTAAPAWTGSATSEWKSAPTTAEVPFIDFGVGPRCLTETTRARRRSRGPGCGARGLLLGTRGGAARCFVGGRRLPGGRRFAAFVLGIRGRKSVVLLATAPLPREARRPPRGRRARRCMRCIPRRIGCIHRPYRHRRRARGRADGELHSISLVKWWVHTGGQPNWANHVCNGRNSGR